MVSDQEVAQAVRRQQGIPEAGSGGGSSGNSAGKNKHPERRPASPSAPAPAPAGSKGNNSTVEKGSAAIDSALSAGDASGGEGQAAVSPKKHHHKTAHKKSFSKAAAPATPALETSE